MKKLLRFIANASIVFAPPAVLLFIQILRVVFLPNAYVLDITAHFLGGLTISWSAMIAWSFAKKAKYITTFQPWMMYYMIATAGLVVGVFWEWWEFWMQRWTGSMYQPTIADTMQDLFMDLIGGIFFIILAKQYFLERSKKKR